MFGESSARSSDRDIKDHKFRSTLAESKLEEILARDRFQARDRFLARNRSTSVKPSHLYGHPLFRSSHGDLTGRSNGHTQGQLTRFASQRDLTPRLEWHVGGGHNHNERGRGVTRSDPARSSRHRHQHTEGTRSREILATISPRRLPSSASTRDGCNRCLIPSGLWENAAFHY